MFSALLCSGFYTFLYSYHNADRQLNVTDSAKIVVATTTFVKI